MASDDWNEVEDEFWNAIKDLEVEGLAKEGPVDPPRCIEGKITVMDSGEYGIYAILETPDGEEIQTPSHKNLQNKLKRRNIGDTVRLCLVELKDIGQPSLLGVYRVFWK